MSSNVDNFYTSRRRPITTAKPYKLSKLPRRGTTTGSVFLFLSVQVLLMANTILASNQLFVTKDECHCDTSLSSILWRYCECVCVGASCYYHDHGYSKIQRNTGFRSNFKSTRRLAGRNSIRSPWIVPRGGGMNENIHLTEQQQTENSAPQPQRMIPLSSLPLIDTKSVSLALRLTCETNRRLHHGTSFDGGSFKSYRKATAAAAASTEMSVHTQHPHTHPQQQMVSGSNLPVIRSVSEEELVEERRKKQLTVFHSMELWEPMGEDKHGNITDSQNDAAERAKSQESRTGALHWGPDLLSYLDTLLSAIGLVEINAPNGGDSSSTTHTTNNRQLSPIEDELQIILSLTLLYLDRSTSLDTPLHVDPQTGHPWSPPCPHLLPRTVHRMLLTAIIVATKCVRGDKSVSNALREAANSILGEKCAISGIDLEQMENWMLHALGGATGMHSHQHGMSWQISQEEIGVFQRKWAGTFYPQRLAAHDQSRMNQLERFWSDQTAVFGTNHGHGNYWPDKTGDDHHRSASLQYNSMDYPSSHDAQNHQWQSPEHLSHNDMAQQQYYEKNSEPF